MRSHLTVIFICTSYLISLKSASAAYRVLIARQDCESVFCLPNIPGAVEGAWGFLGAGFGWVINSVTGLLEPASPKTSQSPGFGKNASPTARADIEMFVEGQRPPEQQCNTAPGSVSDLGYNPGSNNPRPCAVATEQIIWTVSCESTDQNNAVSNSLGEMDTGFLTSTDPLCPVKGGVIFWLAKLTPDQTEAIKRQTASVKAVALNAPYRIGELTVSPSKTKRARASATEKRSRLEERDITTVLKQDDADISLSFLSTTKGKLNSRTYAYFERAGAGVRTYLVDTGVNMLDEEFLHQRLHWLYAIGSMQEPYDISPRGDGTCIGSKIVGLKFGVAKRAALVVVKIRPSTASFLDGLGKIIEDIEERHLRGYNIRGWNVINIRGGWDGFTPDMDEADSLIAQRMEVLIKLLVDQYGVVIVTASGQDERTSHPEISVWPAALASRHDIITVGSVRARGGPGNGERFPWSHGDLFDEALTVNAPGNGVCSSSADEVQDVEGNGFSSSIVTGLVAGFLSHPDLGNHLRSERNLPGAVIEYLRRMSYTRWPGVRSVWNGLDSEKDQTRFVNWLGTPVE